MSYVNVIVNLCVLFVETISQGLSSGTQETSIELCINLETQGTNKGLISVRLASVVAAVTGTPDDCDLFLPSIKPAIKCQSLRG